jgi:hypothetical protein
MVLVLVISVHFAIFTAFRSISHSQSTVIKKGYPISYVRELIFNILTCSFNDTRYVPPVGASPENPPDVAVGVSSGNGIALVPQVRQGPSGHH